MVASKKRILVVDDEPVVRDSCELALADAGYSVRTVASGRDAILACRRERYDVMFTDIRMPDMDGMEVAKVIAREFPDVRVVVITGYPSRESLEQARNIGVFDYLEKPLTPERLSSATADALASAPKARSAVAEGPVPELPAVAKAAPATAPAVVPLASAPAHDMSLLQGIGLLAAAPFIGLAFVVFLPLVGFGVLFGMLGMALAKRLGWSRK
jgi:DNA-binding NtrC family response regulator